MCFPLHCATSPIFNAHPKNKNKKKRNYTTKTLLVTKKHHLICSRIDLKKNSWLPSSPGSNLSQCQHVTMFEDPFAGIKKKATLKP